MPPYDSAGSSSTLPSVTFIELSLYRACPLPPTRPPIIASISNRLCAEATVGKNKGSTKQMRRAIRFTAQLVARLAPLMKSSMLIVHEDGQPQLASLLGK